MSVDNIRTALVKKQPRAKEQLSQLSVSISYADARGEGWLNYSDNRILFHFFQPTKKAELHGGSALIFALFFVSKLNVHADA